MSGGNRYASKMRPCRQYGRYTIPATVISCTVGKWRSLVVVKLATPHPTSAFSRSSLESNRTVSGKVNLVGISLQQEHVYHGNCRDE